MTRSGPLLALLFGACSFDVSGFPARDAGAELRSADYLAERAPDRDRSGEGGADDLRHDLAPDAKPAPGLTPLAVDDGRLWLAESGGLKLLTFQAQNATWKPETTLPAVGGEVRWIAYQILPAEELVAFKVKTSSGHLLELWSSTGGPWTKLGSEATGDSDKRDFQLVQEAQSRAALLVHGDGSARPAWRRIQGGAITPSARLPLNDGGGPGPDLSTGKVLWVELVPRPQSDEVALLFAEENADLVTILWDGGKWDPASGFVLETELKRNPKTQTISNRAFDGAYESTGALLAAWGRHDVNGFHWRRRPPGGSWTSAAKVDALAGVPHAVDLAGEPGGDRIAAGLFDLGDGTERLGLATWDGSKWGGAKEYSKMLDVNDTATGDTPGAVAWRGGSKQAVVVYSDETAGQIDYGTWNKGDWSIEKDQPVGGKGFTESVELRSLSLSDKLLLVVSDDKSGLHFATFDGAWSAGGQPLSTSLAPPSTVPFALELKR